MKAILPFIIAMLLLVAGCDRGKVYNDIIHMPPSGGTERFDSLFAELDSCVLYRHPLAEEESIYNLLVLESCRKKLTPQVKARLSLYNSNISFLHGRRDVARDTLVKAVAAIDSVRYPMDFHRLRLLLARYLDDLYEAHRIALEAAEYFNDNGHFVLEQFARSELGHIYSSLQMQPEERATYLSIDSFFLVNNMECARIVNLVNLARASEKPLRDSLNCYLLNHPFVRHDNVIYYVVIGNTYANGPGFNLHYLEMMDSLIAVTPELSCEAAQINMVFGEYYDRYEHDLPRALEYARRALVLADSDSSTQIRLRRNIYHLTSEIYHQMEIGDSSEKYLRLVVHLDSVMATQAVATNVSRAEKCAQIKQRELEKKLYRHRRTTGVIIGVALMTVAGLIIALLIIRHNARRRIRHLNTVNELRRARYLISSQMASLDDRNRLMDEIGEILGQADMCNSLASRIDNAIKVHLSGNAEHDAMITVHKNLSPEFTRRLIAAYPSLTPSQLQLASFIASGLSNAQMARIMNISHASLNTARYRLRRRMALPASVTLEHALQQFA